jgi:hypothetical protein
MTQNNKPTEKSVVKCNACGFEIDADRMAAAMGLGGYANVMMPISRCPRCRSANIAIERRAIKKSACFVATAVYGSPSHPAVCALRDWRDQSLARTYLGRSFIKAYLLIGPLLARPVAKSPWLRKTTRMFLDSFVRLISRKESRATKTSVLDS